jgi:hypothetical protein
MMFKAWDANYRTNRAMIRQYLQVAIPTYQVTFKKKPCTTIEKLQRCATRWRPLSPRSRRQEMRRYAYSFCIPYRQVRDTRRVFRVEFCLLSSQTITPVRFSSSWRWVTLLGSPFRAAILLRSVSNDSNSIRPEN